MSKSKVRPYPKHVRRLMAEKTKILTQARTCSDLDMEELAVHLWNSAAAHEERIAPMLETLDRHLEAALHRVSAANCYQKGGELSRAANLYRAALAGPLTAGAILHAAGDSRVVGAVANAGGVTNRLMSS